MNKGEIYYICKTAVEAPDKYVIQPGRPAIVVSSASVNATQNVVSVVFLTSKPKHAYPTHFITRCQGVTGTALCEEICTVDKARVGKYVGKLSDYEMENLNNCLRHTFDLGEEVPYASNENLAEANKTIERLRAQITAYKTLLFNTEDL